MSDFGNFADIHCHTLLKYAANNSPDLWDPIGMPQGWLALVLGIFKKLPPRNTTADFNTLARGEVQVVCVALTPPEQRTLKFKGNIPQGALNKFSSYIGRLPLTKLKEFQSEAYDHHKELLAEKRLYEGGQNITGKVKLPSIGKATCKYKILKNGAELENILAANRASNNARTIAVVFTIESAHALGTGHIKFNGQPNKFNVSEDILLKRVDSMKGLGSAEAAAWNYSPLWMTMTHVFFNSVCGFAQAIEPGFRPLLDYAEPFAAGTDVTTHPPAINKGLTPLGKKIIERLLGIDAVSTARASKGRRILVDIKHMSTLSRKEYYAMLDSHHAAHPDDIIPVLMSHAAVNGKPLLNENNYNPGDTDEESENSDMFSPRSINLYDDEIVRIHKTKGLIGLIFYDPILGGHKRKKNNIFWGREKWAALFADQIEHIVKTVYNTSAADKKEIWNRIGLGSDFDGQINPADEFASAERYPEFRMEMRTFLNEARFDPYRSKGEVEGLVNKICFSNVIEFIKRNLK